ncbi:hypothetical protein CWI75_16185 [Kineobactrum sediminis]|uniref:DAGKc domain-containing protein n=1 Tax=Kineobactrum sediminis TaxID=1905677 RepID=A0A2N5XZ01_9GAMM|nr:diacylglycerol kinase family protein [Kineobactrum sediminis]PLW81370.1 hypothetical protein CWI75_16185 [Kineobactrum sediminis]
MRAILIHNPDAASGTAAGETAVLALLRDAGYDTAIGSLGDQNWEKGLAADDIVVASGGDGTISKVAGRLAGQPAAIAILPRGTANNVARSLGLLGMSLAQLIESWATADRCRVDLGRISGIRGPEYFLEGVGVGLYADIMARLNATDNAGIAHLETPDKLLEMIAILRHGLQERAPVPIHGTLDERDISGDYLLIEALNFPFIGPNLKLAPQADPGDGQLDVVLVPETARSALDVYLARCLSGAADVPADLPVLRGRRLQLHGVGGCIHLDGITPAAGTCSGSGILRIEVSDRHVTLLVPSDGIPTTPRRQPTGA